MNGVLSGNNTIGGNAASVQGYGTGGNAGVFAFKYDKANFGDSPQAIQVWNSSSGVYKTFIIDHPQDRLAVERSGNLKVSDGAFTVISDNPRSKQEFDWEVKALRSDGPLLAAEPLKKDVQVGGFGPYTYEVLAGK